MAGQEDIDVNGIQFVASQSEGMDRHAAPSSSQLVGGKSLDFKIVEEPSGTDR